MATVRKRGDYPWQAIVKRKGFSPTSKTFLNRKDVEAWATVTESEMLRGVFIPRAEAEKTTLKEALERYRDEVTARKKGKSRGNYSGIHRKPQQGFLEGLRFHDLRHEATSRLFERGDFSMMEVASITGHKTLVMLKRYTHLKAEDLARKLG